MKGTKNRKVWGVLILASIVLALSAAGSVVLRDVSKAFGGNFSPMSQPQQTGHFQIASRDANSAWVIDTIEGDVFLIFGDGKWKEVGSVLDEKKRVKK